MHAVGCKMIQSLLAVCTKCYSRTPHTPTCFSLYWRDVGSGWASFLKQHQTLIRSVSSSGFCSQDSSIISSVHRGHRSPQSVEKIGVWYLLLHDRTKLRIWSPGEIFWGYVDRSQTRAITLNKSTPLQDTRNIVINITLILMRKPGMTTVVSPTCYDYITMLLLADLHFTTSSSNSPLPTSLLGHFRLDYSALVDLSECYSSTVSRSRVDPEPSSVESYLPSLTYAHAQARHSSIEVSRLPHL